ncbi:Uncharacterized protein FKW44_008346 [Caligus rogercresseyi]|uniref:Uncharacterized protein n=1 Tax=Caligus rogercresseyi TaxID=217165 RepID=A0A7T8KGA8_CALRO|nr:Uncharacterized protein FKW44_008346 [Caligus rogercresseyi]
MHFWVQNCWLQKRLADYQPLQPSNLKAIFLVAAARSGSLDLRIPSTKDDSWTYGAQDI